MPRIRSLAQHLRRVFLREGPWPKSPKLLVAVSGGCDSVVLLDLLGEIAPRLGIVIEVAHFDHRLRGEESTADARWVREHCKRMGLPFHGGSGDVRSAAHRSGISLEMAAREKRHQFLVRTAKRLRADAIALAHHADDQFELFFLRLFRGSGPEGLRGMGASGPSPIDASVRIIRPLIDVTRDEMERHARRRGLAWREDSTNRDISILRNRIRHRLKPWLLREFGPAALANIARTVRALGDSDVTPGQQAPDRVRESIRKELIRHGIEHSFERIEALRQDPPRPVAVPGGRVIREDTGERLRIHRLPEGKPKEASIASFRIRIPRFGKLKIPSKWSKRVVGEIICTDPGKVPIEAGWESLDAERLGASVMLRTRRPGDRFRPIGRQSASKLQDLMVNRKIPASLRDLCAVLVCCDEGSGCGGSVSGETGRIAWVGGLPVGEEFKITNRTTRVLRLKQLAETDPAGHRPV